MTKFFANVNNNRGRKSTDVSDVCWEVVRNHEYKQENLLKVISLYMIKIKNSIAKGIQDVEDRTLVVRITVNRDCAFFNRSVNVDVLNGIFPHKFTSKRKSYSARLQDLYKDLCRITDTILPKEVEDSFIQEYEDILIAFNRS